MIKHATVDYIMDDPREAARLKAKVDPEAWAHKYMGGRIRSGMEVLSVGCGPGVILAAVCDLHPSVRGTGLDISSDRVKEAAQMNRGNPRTRFVCGDAQAMQFPPDSFDLVYCRMLLQYLPNKERAVAEMARVCTPGGLGKYQGTSRKLPFDRGRNRTRGSEAMGAEAGYRSAPDGPRSWRRR
jgi:ubiquinone/menaquinone biosynthesis C-methylase UbiE